MALLWLVCQAAGAEESAPEVKRDHGAIDQRAHFSSQLQLWFLHMDQDKGCGADMQPKGSDFACQSDKCHAKGRESEVV